MTSNKNAVVEKLSINTPQQHDAVNAALGFRFIRALAVEKAALDRTLSPACVRILAGISYFMNSQIKRAWPSYKRISEITGYSEDVIDKSIRRLKVAGYLFTERRAPVTGGRALVHYGLAALHPSDIDSMISDAVSKLRRNAEAQSAHPAKKSGAKLTPPKRAKWVSDPAIFVPSDPAVIIPQEPSKEEPQVIRTGGPFSIAARAYDEKPPCDDVKLVVLDQGRDVVADGNSIAKVLARLGVANPTKSRRAKVADTLTKAALQWKGMDGRHPRYKTLSDWFVAEWLPGLRADLEKLADATTPRRFTIKLEDQIVIGVGDARFSLTRDGINAKLNDAEALLGGMPTVLRDFDAAKEKSRHASNLVIDIATATLRRVQGEAALRFTEVEKTDFAAILVADGFDKADVDGIVEEFAKQADLNQNRGRFFLSNFPFSAHTVLLDRTMYRRRALTYMRAGLECIAKDKENQRILWEQGAARGRNSAPFEYNKSNGLEYPEPDSIGDFAPA